MGDMAQLNDMAIVRFGAVLNKMLGRDAHHFNVVSETFGKSQFYVLLFARGCVFPSFNLIAEIYVKHCLNRKQQRTTILFGLTLMDKCS